LRSADNRRSNPYFNRLKVRPRALTLRASHEAKPIARQRKVGTVDDQRPIDTMPAISPLGPAWEF
jgi:hypothetical protein